MTTYLENRPSDSLRSTAAIRCASHPWLSALATLMIASAFVALPAWAQDDQFIPEDGEEQTEPAADGADSLRSTVDFGAIDDLLASDEEVLSDPGTYSYDPGIRRDPFRSLLVRRDATVDEERERPEGIPGLLIDELTIEGIFILDEGPVAQVQAANADTSYLLRPGDELWDGDVVRITQEEIVFKQSVQDPTAIKPFRDVVRKLDPSGQ
ncbi:MAG: hypothetical protein AAF725_21815 [Acidobacteriota bacterium]